MAGFSINVQKILDKPEVRVGLLEDGKPTKRGYLETSFLENFATRKTVECRGLSNEVWKRYNIPYSHKYWQELNLAIEPQNRYCKNISGFKFGGSVRDRHTYNTIICK